MKYYVSDNITVSWQSPNHFNGNLEGYLFQYWLVSNSSANISDIVEIFTKKNFVEISLPLENCNDDENIFYQLQVTAYNVAEGNKLFGAILEEKVDICSLIIPGGSIEL